MAYVFCDGCNRVLNEEDGPTCEDCQAVARSAASARGWETRREREEAAGTEDVSARVPLGTPNLLGADDPSTRQERRESD